MYGRKVLGKVGRKIQVLVDSNFSEAKVGGITIDWALVAAVAGAPVEVQDGLTVQIGNKYLRYGQIMCEVTAVGANKGYYGPYNPAAADGREVLTPGKCFFLNETVVKDALPGVPFNTVESDIIGVWDMGRVYIERILHSGVAAHSLAAGPTLEEFTAAFPRVQPVWF